MTLHTSWCRERGHSWRSVHGLCICNLHNRIKNSPVIIVLQLRNITNLNLKKVVLPKPKKCNFSVLALSFEVSVALLWQAQVLTSAAQTLLPQTQRAPALVAVNTLVEAFHPPEMLPILLGHLIVNREHDF